ncbi:unnamed protein product [Bathycoccus prasinos]
MFQTRSEYDRGVNTFSPEGRLFQVEYAIEAIKLGSTALAISTKHGIVLAVEKRITSPLMEPSSMDKIMEIDSHCACAVSGIIYFTFNEPMPVESLCQTLCRLAMSFGGEGEKSMSRPFGVALLVAGFDEEDKGNDVGGGTKTKCRAKSIGSGSEGAQTSLNEEYREDLTLEEAETMAMSTLKAVMEEKVNVKNVDFAVLKSPKFQVYDAKKIQEIIDRAA